jgi:hypothetical protein
MARVCSSNAISQVGNDQIRIQNLDVMIAGDVARSHGARPLLVQAHFGDIAGMHADGHGLQVQQDVDDIFLHALDGGVFVQYAFDLNLGNRGSRQGRQQHPAQGIAQRMTESPFERFDHDTRMTRRHRLHFDDPWLQEFIDRSLHGYHLR